MSSCTRSTMCRRGGAPRRENVRSAKQVRAGLLARAQTSGFSIERDRLYIDGYEQVRIPREGNRPISFSTLIFQGVLTVDAPERFLANVLRGFGAAKAFGCGLMLIRRAGA